MRDLRLLNPYRIANGGSFGDAKHGAFQIPSPIDRAVMTILASADLGWDHVSVSRRKRSPNQTELDFVFRLFFCDDETAVQYFVPRDEHVNNMPFCLHLWRPLDEAFSKPPSEMVGIGSEPITSPAQARVLRDEADKRLGRA